MVTRRPESAASDELFGDLAFHKGYVTKAQLYEAITEQKRKELRGREIPRLGALLLEMGALTPDQVSEILEEQARP